MADRIKWVVDPVDCGNGFHGQCGMIRYQVSPPNMTPGWRVWCMLQDQSGRFSASVGGLIVTMKAPDLDAAKAAAETHLAELVKGLGVIEDAYKTGHQDGRTGGTIMTVDDDYEQYVERLS